MSTLIRGKTVMSRSKLTLELVEANGHHDGPWEPAIVVDADDVAKFQRETLRGWYLLHQSARVEHDPEGRHDIHLPGDGEPFDVDAVVAKLLIAEVVAR